MKVSLLLETLASGQVAASVLEFPWCWVEAVDRESAIATLKATFLEHIANTATLTGEIPESEPAPAWLKFAGVFRDAPDFDAIIEELRAEHDSDNNSEVDPSYCRQSFA